MDKHRYLVMVPQFCYWTELDAAMPREAVVITYHDWVEASTELYDDDERESEFEEISLEEFIAKLEVIDITAGGAQARRFAKMPYVDGMGLFHTPPKEIKGYVARPEWDVQP